MNIREMHIELNQSLQKVAANKTRKYLSEELDWVLNKIQNRFIQSKLKPKKGGAFTVEQIELDAIRPLLTQKKLPAYIDPNFTNRYEVYLPTDYAYLISDSSYVSDMCGMQSAPVELTKQLFITWLKQVYTTKPSSPFYETVLLNIDITNTISIPGGLPYTNTYTGFSRKEDISFLTSWIVNQGNTFNSIQCGFERYGKRYKPQHYVLVSQDHQIQATLEYDGTPVTAVSTETLNVKQHQSLTNENITSNRLETSEIIPQILDVAFYKPSVRSPVSELIGNVLYIYRDDNFTVNSSLITYVRKPQPVSLALGSDCELAPEFHQTICDLAVEYIKNRLENAQGYQIVERDNEQRVIL